MPSTGFQRLIGLYVVLAFPRSRFGLLFRFQETLMESVQRGLAAIVIHPAGMPHFAPNVFLSSLRNELPVTASASAVCALPTFSMSKTSLAFQA